MKKTIFAFAFLLVTATVSAQFYISASGGPSFKAAEKKLSPSGNMGSYGEGIQVQLRGGYFFNEKFGVDLGVGYLHGDKQNIINQSGTYITGKARAFGAALTGVYNVTKNMYVRAGLLTKLGGKTIVNGYISSQLPAVLFDPSAPATYLVPMTIDFTRNNKGKFPIGFLGALGWKFDVWRNFGIFAEVEYMGINVDADKSTLGDFSASIGSRKFENASEFPDAIKAQLGDLLVDEVNYSNSSRSIQAPYSSIGFNFGIIYTFK